MPPNEEDEEGNITEKYEDGTKYIGWKEDGEKSGDGTLFFNTGLVNYQGEWSENV